MQISVGDEGGTSQAPPNLAPPLMAQTTKASQRPQFSFANFGGDDDDEEDGVDEETGGQGDNGSAKKKKKGQASAVTHEERQQIKKVLTQSLSNAELRK